MLTYLSSTFSLSLLVTLPKLFSPLLFSLLLNSFLLSSPLLSSTSFSSFPLAILSTHQSSAMSASVRTTLQTVPEALPADHVTKSKVSESKASSKSAEKGHRARMSTQQAPPVDLSGVKPPLVPPSPPSPLAGDFPLPGTPLPLVSPLWCPPPSVVRPPRPPLALKPVGIRYSRNLLSLSSGRKGVARADAVQVCLWAAARASLRATAARTRGGHGGMRGTFSSAKTAGTRRGPVRRAALSPFSLGRSGRAALTLAFWRSSRAAVGCLSAFAHPPPHLPSSHLPPSHLSHPLPLPPSPSPSPSLPAHTPPPSHLPPTPPPFTPLPLSSPLILTPLPLPYTPSPHDPPPLPPTPSPRPHSTYAQTQTTVHWVELLLRLAL
ncbi:hypothetical protein C7M84_004234 [Penaeus vannamei]|uniref:Uncharacterized protein n=1 Tax=Penaeus vannamei TaxID=6689 RepID=A0A423TL23_PENVA|nr:hypothetical protein C7M84_004234 [Penaeus vannamei]